MIRRFLVSACLIFLLTPALSSQTPSSSDDAELKFVVYLSRHGVRSPTGKLSQYNAYSTAPWPAWDVPPGHLTAHGYHLMEIFGAYDRMLLAKENLLKPTGCDDGGNVTFYADSDQRTRETGKALASGLFPGCSVPVQSLAEGVNDPLFHPVPAHLGPLNSTLATAAIAGRIGNNLDNLTEAHRTQLASFDKLLETCGVVAASPQKRISLFEISPSLSPGSGDHLAELRSPLSTASTLTENLLLEYTEGMDTANVGWGCVDGPKLRSLIDLHTAASDFAQRTPAIARMQASNLLDHIDKALEQIVTHQSIPGAPSKPTDRALFLIGHDTNLSNIGGLLDMTWIIDGRRDDTPPGGALIFELWKKHKSDGYFVRIYYTAQTLEQMRSTIILTPTSPPQRVPVFIPGCSKEDFSCAWPAFSETIRKTIDPQYVSPK